MNFIPHAKSRMSRLSLTREPRLQHLGLRASLFEDAPLRLKSVIKGALADALLIDLAGSRRDPCVEILRHGRFGRTGLLTASRLLARRLQCGRFLRFQGFHTMSSPLNQARNARLRRPQGGVKDRVDDVVVAFVPTRAWFMRIVRRHVRPKPALAGYGKTISA